MAAESSDQPSDPSSPAPEASPVPKKKKRTWLKVIGALLLVLILLIVFLPTIASTGPVKSFVVNKVNENLNGKVQVNDWSIGWASGIDIDGVKVLDAQGITVLTVSRVRVPMSLINAARGNYALGDVLIDKPDLVKLEIDDEGRTNLEKLVKEDPSKPREPKPEEETGELPHFSGKVTIKELRGSIFKAGGGPALMVIKPSDIIVDVPDSNGPISNDIKLAFSSAEGKTGTISLAGSVDVIENNKLAVEQMTADQKLALADVDFAALEPILQMARVDATLAGVANGSLAVKGAPSTDVSASGEIKIDNFAFGGEMLKGDTFKTSVLRIPVQVTSTIDGGVTRVKASNTGVHFDQGSVVVSADAPLDAIQNAAAQKPPGRDGTLAVDVKIPRLADLANQLPNTLQLAAGVKLTEGDLSEVVNVTLSKEAATFVSTLDLKNVKGTKDAAPLRPLDPVHLTAGATSHGGTDLRNLLLQLTSGFATIEIPKGEGESLARLTVAGNVDLQKLREQAGQFTDALDPVETGTGTFTLKTNGDLTKENSLVATNFDLQLDNLSIVEPATTTQPARPMLREPWMKLGVTGGVQRGTQSFIEGVKGLVVTLQTNNPQKPTIDLEASADLVMKTEGDATVVTAPAFELTKLNVDIPAARNEFRTFLQALDENGLEPTAGRIALNNAMAGSYDGKVFSIAPDAPLSLVVANVTMQKSEAGKQTTPIDDRTIRVDAAGTFDVGGETFAAKVSKLALVEDRKLFSLTKSDDGDLVVRIPPGGTVQGNGSLVLIADLVGVNQVAAAFGSPLIEKQPDGSMDLQSGLLGARVKLTATDKETNIAGGVDVKNLTLTTWAEPIRDETIQTVMTLTSPADGSAVSGKLNVVSSFVTAAVENLQLQLQKQVGSSGATTQPAVWEMVRNADVSADVASLSKAYTLYSALSPATQPAATPPAEAGLANEAPLNITGGSAKVTMKVARAGDKTNIDLSEARISNLAFAKGPGSFKSPRDMLINLAASLDATDVIRQITVSKLTGDLAVANARLEEPLVISNLDTNASAKGALKVDGKIEEISRLLEALGGQAPGTGYPYGGQLAMTQRVSSAGGPIQLTGNVRATDFVVYQQGSDKPSFTEKQLDLTQDVTIDTAAKKAAIKTLTLDMPSSGALKLAITGGLSDWEKARQLDNVRADITYDLAKLWPVIRPLISETPEDYKDLVIAGQATRTFLIGGSYPADLPFHEAVKTLTASGGLAIQKFSYLGLDIEELELPIALKPGGELATVYADRPKEKRLPPPAKCNGGTLNLGGVVVNLGYEQPRLSIGKKHRLLSEVSMNPLFADNILGKFINPAFVDPEEARGLIDLTVAEVTNVPLGDLITMRNDGKANLILSIREVNIGNKFLNNLVTRLKPNAFNEKSVQANIRDAQLSIENGILNQDMVFMIDKLGLHFDGKVRLADQALLPLNLKIPTAMMKFDDNLRRYLPDEITVPITGTTTAPKWNLDVVVQNLAIEAGKKALLGNVLDRAGGQSSRGGSTTQPAKEDPLGGLLENILGGKKREEERKPADRISQPKK
ncbi:MAG: hypothetical protein WBD40_08670 [Tepidisphaeraceae bacterium]